MTLTETAQLTKRGAAVLIIALTAGFTGRAAWSRIKPIIFPPQTPPPEVAFGKLLRLEIPGLPLAETSKPEYVVDTTTGRLPQDLPDRAKVYRIILPETTLLTSQRAKDLAAKLGFSQSPQKISSSEYRFENSEEGRILQMNITTGNFDLETDVKKLTDLASGSPPSKAAAVEQAATFLQNLGLLNDDYTKGRKDGSYLKIEGGILKKVDNLSSAHLTRVDFFRKIEEQPIVGAKPYGGLITVILGKDSVPFVSYHFWPLNPSQSTTYPLKTVEQMWSETQEGKAQIVFLAPANADPFASYEPSAPEKLFVTKIYLGYFDSEKFQEYLQPVYILEGLGLTADRVQLKLIAYVPAVADDWVKKEK